MSDELNPEEISQIAEEIIRVGQKRKEISTFAKETFGPLLEAKKKGKTLDESSERALVIRDHCLSLIRSLNSFSPVSLLEGEIPTKDEAIREITGSKEALREFDIQLDPYTPYGLERNPLKTAEYIASRLIGGIDEDTLNSLSQQEDEGKSQTIGKVIQSINRANHYLGNSIGMAREIK